MATKNGFSTATRASSEPKPFTTQPFTTVRKLLYAHIHPLLTAESCHRMSRKVFLLTFNKLPNRQLAGEDSPFTQAYERLDSTSAFFEQHYVQSPGMEAILGNSAAVAEMEHFLADNQESALALSVGSRHANGWDNLPRGFQRESVSEIANVNVESVSGTNNQIVWLYCLLDPAQTEAEQRAQFEQCLAWCREQASAADSLLLVTSITGHELPDIPFESVLFDGSVRVPLWIEVSTKQASRVQCSTGSYDVVPTLLHWLKSSRDETHGQSQETIRQPISLVDLVQRTGEHPKRIIDIWAKQVVAVRTEDFMFCQELDEHDPPSDYLLPPGLYSKPEDIWNIHNVAAEYHDLICDFQSRLPQSK